MPTFSFFLYTYTIFPPYWATCCFPNLPCFLVPSFKSCSISTYTSPATSPKSIVFLKHDYWILEEFSRWNEASGSEGCKGWTLVDTKVCIPDALSTTKAPMPLPIESVAYWLLQAEAFFSVQRSSTLASIWNRSEEPNQPRAPSGSGWGLWYKSVPVHLLPLSNPVSLT